MATGPANYIQRAVVPPSEDEVKAISLEFGFTIGDADIADFTEHVTGVLEGTCNVLDKMVPPTLPVNYPRTPGFKPEPEDNKLNAWYWRCDIPGADAGLLKGKTVAIKDNVCVAGVPMANGSKIMEGFVPDIDATVVTRILDAGGRILGKSSCENLCWSGSCFTNLTGSTLNPHDTSRGSGGSSGGSAALVQTGAVDLAIGGDQAGSIRIPASWCGIVGLKPTHGLVPYTGAVPIEITIDHLGPMTKTVADCALLLEVIAGFDAFRDPRQPRDLTVPRYSKLYDADVSRKKVGLLLEGFEGCQPEVQTVVREAAMKLSSAGLKVEEVSMPLHKIGGAVWGPICIDGSYQCMVKGSGNGFHYKGYFAEGISNRLREGFEMNKRNWSEPLMLMAIMGRFAEKTYGSKYYGRAQNLNMKLTQTYDEVLKKYDVLVMPTLPFVAPLLPPKDSTVKERLEHALNMSQNTAPFDATGHPALTINAGMVSGLPVGMMIVGKHFDDLTVLQIARAFEKIRG